MPFAEDGAVFLFATLGSDTPFKAHYNGCAFFKMADLDASVVSLERTLEVELTRENFFGSCDYSQAASAAGVVYGRLFVDLVSPSASEFQVLASGQDL